MHWLQQVLLLADLSLAAALVVKLAVTGLIRIYVWFSAFLCFEIARGLILLWIPPNTGLYAWIFLITEPLMWILYIMVVLELYEVALRKYQGVATLSRWILSAGMAVSVAVSALTLWMDLSRPTGQYRVLVYYSVVERGLIFSLSLFLLLITGFLAWFPLSISRNIRLHASVYFLYFLSSTLALFLRNVAGYSISPMVSNILSLLDAVCFALWLGGLSRRGEERLVVRRKWQPEDEERLMRQLDALSTAVLKRPND